MIGPATLDFLRNFASRHASLDTVTLYTFPKGTHLLRSSYAHTRLTHPQLAHMLKHVTTPLTALAGAEAAGLDLLGTARPLKFATRSWPGPPAAPRTAALAKLW